MRQQYFAVLGQGSIEVTKPLTEMGATDAQNGEGTCHRQHTGGPHHEHIPWTTPRTHPEDTPTARKPPNRDARLSERRYWVIHLLLRIW